MPSTLLLVLALLPAIVFSSSVDLESLTSPTISTSGTISYGRQVDFGAIRGVNLNGYDINDNTFSANDYERIKSWGCNTVQFCLLWHLIEPNYGVYNTAFLNKVDAQISLAKGQGLWIIIRIGTSRSFAESGGWISEDNLWTNATVQNRFYELWRMLVNRYKNYDNILAWNLLNEPSAQASDSELVEQLWNGNGEISSNNILGVRQLDDRPIIFMPARSSASTFSLLEPVPFENVVYAVSLYEPYSVTSLGQEYDGNYDFLKNFWAPAKTFSSTYNVQVWISEFGIDIDSYGGEPPSESRALWVQHVCNLASEEKIGWCYWIYSYGGRWQYDLLNDDGSERIIVSILKDALSA